MRSNGPGPLSGGARPKFVLVSQPVGPDQLSWQTCPPVADLSALAGPARRGGPARRFLAGKYGPLW